MLNNVWDEIAHLFQNFNGCYFIPYFIMDVVTHPWIVFVWNEWRYKTKICSIMTIVSARTSRPGLPDIAGSTAGDALNILPHLNYVNDTNTCITFIHRIFPLSRHLYRISGNLLNMVMKKDHIWMLDSFSYFLGPYIIEIILMNLKNNRAPPLCYVSFCPFQSHWWIQTGVTGKKCSVWV